MNLHTNQNIQNVAYWFAGKLEKWGTHLSGRTLPSRLQTKLELLLKEINLLDIPAEEKIRLKKLLSDLRDEWIRLRELKEST